MILPNSVILGFIHTLNYYYNRIALWFIHEQYLNLIHDASVAGPDRAAKWTQLTEEVRLQCQATRNLALSTLCIMVFIAQDSTKPFPRALALGTIVMDLDALGSTAIIGAFVRLRNSDEEGLRKFMGSWDESTRVTAASTFAIPQASFLWCTSLTVISIYSYCGQAEAPLLSLAVRFMSRGAWKLDSNPQPAEQQQTIVVHPILPLIVHIFIGFLVVFVAVRLLLIARSVARLKSDRSGDAEAGHNKQTD